MDYQDTRSELVRADEWITRTLALGGRQQRPPRSRARGGNDGYTSKAAWLQLQSLPLHPRRMADSSRNDMLFSSGDSPNSLSDPFGGWGRQREQGESL